VPLPAAHDTRGLDLPTRETPRCTLAPDGAVAERRIATTRAAFTAALGGRPPARVLLEASTESEWVARHLESLGHEVVVADPGDAPMYATRSRRVNTDKRDARTLAEACRLGAYRLAHRLSDPQRHVRAELAVRDARPTASRAHPHALRGRAQGAGSKWKHDEGDGSRRVLHPTSSPRRGPATRSRRRSASCCPEW